MHSRDKNCRNHSRHGYELYFFLVVGGGWYVEKVAVWEILHFLSVSKCGG